MAAKDLAIGSKRKASGASKGKSDTKPKKAKVEKAAEPEEDVEMEDDDFESFSDSEDGGARLGEDRSKKPPFKKNDANGNNFDRTGAYILRLLANALLTQHNQQAKPRAKPTRSRSSWPPNARLLSPSPTKSTVRRRFGRS